MNRNKFLFTFLILLQFISILGSAQDVSYSLPYSVPQQLNPAFAGIQGGHFFSIRHRAEWKNLKGVNFENNTISYDFPLFFASSEAGLGIAATQDKAGGLNTTIGLITGSYDAPFGGMAGGNHFRSGLQMMLTHKKLDFDQLKFADQYSGNGTFTGTSQEKIVTNEGDYNFDANFGFIWYKTDPEGMYTKFHPYLGGAVHRINFSKSTEFGGSGDISPLYLVQGGFRLKSVGGWNIKPGVVFITQNKNNQTNIDISFQKIFGYSLNTNNRNSFTIGATWKAGTSMVVYTGIELKNVRIGFAYDYLITDLIKVSNSSNSGYEINLAYLINRSRKKTTSSLNEGNGNVTENPSSIPTEIFTPTRNIPIPIY